MIIIKMILSCYFQSFVIACLRACVYIKYYFFIRYNYYHGGKIYPNVSKIV